MNTKYTDEDLLMALPDFARGAELDEELEALLRKKLDADDSFRNEYQNILKTFRFLSQAKFSEPPDHYFSNLSVKINERIETASGVSWWEKLGLFWKILIPVLPVLIVMLLYFFNREDNSNNMLTHDTTNKSEIPSQISSVPAETPAVSDSDIQQLDSENANSKELLTKSENTYFKLSDTDFFENTNGTDALLNSSLPEISLADNIDNSESQTINETDVLLGTQEIEESVEDEFLELSPEEQSEILEILKNS